MKLTNRKKTIKQYQPNILTQLCVKTFYLDFIGWDMQMPFLFNAARDILQIISRDKYDCHWA